MKVLEFFKIIYYKLSFPNFILIKIYGKIFTKKFNTEVRKLEY